jgi:hypothetical protein
VNVRHRDARLRLRAHRGRPSGALRRRARDIARRARRSRLRAPAAGRTVAGVRPEQVIGPSATRAQGRRLRRHGAVRDARDRRPRCRPAGPRGDVRRGGARPRALTGTRPPRRRRDRARRGGQAARADPHLGALRRQRAARGGAGRVRGDRAAARLRHDRDPARRPRAVPTRRSLRRGARSELARLNPVCAAATWSAASFNPVP